MDKLTGNPLALTIVVIAVLLIVFLLFREINCWYWKVNERLAEQRRTNELLEMLLKEKEMAK
jgi:hypothetical protein